MNDIEKLPRVLRNRSLSSETIILAFEEAKEALTFFWSIDCAAIGFETLYVTDDGELMESRAYVSFLPEVMDWNEFVESSYHQVYGEISKEDESLSFSNISEERIFYQLTFITHNEFEDYYYQYIHVD